MEVHQRDPLSYDYLWKRLITYRDCSIRRHMLKFKALTCKYHISFSSI